MNYRPAAICVDFDAAAARSVAAAPGRCRRSTLNVEDGDNDECSGEDEVIEVVGALTPRTYAAPSPVDLLRALPAATSRDPDDVISVRAMHDVTSPRRTLSMQSPLCCRGPRGDAQARRWNTHVATVPLASDVACTCSAGWMSIKPSDYSPSPTHAFPAPPPVPRRSRTFPTDHRRRSRIDDAYSISGGVDAELAASAQTRRHFDCFRICFSSSEPEQKETTKTTELIGLTTVCRCSSELVDTGSGCKNSRHDELSLKHSRGGRRRHVSHVLIACTVALPVTCLGLLALFLLSPLHKSTTGKLQHLASLQRS